MYKTVRHGENSLQYTILPQTEEVLSNSGLKGRGRDYSPSIHVRRSKKRSAIKYVILIIFGIIITLALASVPIYVLNGTVYANRMTIFVDRAPTTTQPVPTQKEIFMKSRKKELKISPELLSSLKPDITIVSTPPVMHPSELPVVVERATLPPWSMLPAFKFWKASSTVSSTQTAIKNEEAPLRPVMKDEYKLDKTFAKTINENRDLGQYVSKSEWDKVIIKPEVTTGPLTTSHVMKYLMRSTSRPLVEDVLITTKQAITSTKSATALDNRTNKFKDLKEALLSVDDDEDFKESLEVDETKSLPPLKPADLPDMSSNLKIEVDGQDVIISKADSSWMKNKWPFIDPSSYYQWTGFTSSDMFPVLVLGVASLMLIVFISLIFTMSRRSRMGTHTSVAAGRQVDDNTNLLTAENAEEE